MPKKKATEEESAETVVASDAPKATKCGAVDRHSLGPDGKPDYPTCDSKPGHTGDHHAIHKMRVEKNRIYDQVYGKLIDIEYEIVDGDVWFGDAAAVAAKDVVKGQMPGRSKKGELLQTIEELIKA